MKDILAAICSNCCGFLQLSYPKPFSSVPFFFSLKKTSEKNQLWKGILELQLTKPTFLYNLVKFPSISQNLKEADFMLRNSIDSFIHGT